MILVFSQLGHRLDQFSWATAMAPAGRPLERHVASLKETFRVLSVHTQENTMESSEHLDLHLGE